MRKIPVPVMIGLAVAAIVLSSVVVSRTFASRSGDSGDAAVITSDILKNNPRNAQDVPDDQKPAALAVMPIKGKKR